METKIIRNFVESDWKLESNSYTNINLSGEDFGEILTIKEFRTNRALHKKYVDYLEIIAKFSQSENLEVSENKIKDFIEKEIGKTVLLSNDVLEFEDTDSIIKQRVYMDEPGFIGIEHGGYEMLMTTKNWNNLSNLVTQAIEQWQ